MAEKPKDFASVTIRLDREMHKRAKIVAAEMEKSFKELFEDNIARLEVEIAKAKAKAKAKAAK